MANLTSLESTVLEQTVKSFFSDKTFNERVVAEGYDLGGTFTPDEFKAFSRAFIQSALKDLKHKFESEASWDSAKEPALIDAASPMISDQLSSVCKLAPTDPLYYPPSSGFISRVVSWLFSS